MRVCIFGAGAIGGYLAAGLSSVDIDKRINGVARVGAHRTSMLQDLESGRPIEVDVLLTSVQELGRLTRDETPISTSCSDWCSSLAARYTSIRHFPKP